MPLKSAEMSIAGTKKKKKKNRKKKKTSMLIFFGRLGIEEPEHLRMRWRNVWTREKKAVPPDTGAGASYQTSHPGISARAIAFGRSWPFAAFCYRPCLPVRHWGRDMSAPKPYVTNPTPTHSFSDRPCHYNIAYDFDGLYIEKKSHFICHMVSTGVADYKVYACALLKVTYIQA